MRERMERSLEVLSRGANWMAEALMGVLLASMTLLVGAQIAGRFLIGYSIFWSDELARFLLVWIAFLGMSAGVRRARHPGIDTVVRGLPPAWARGAAALSLLLSLLFFAVMLWYGAALVARTWPQRSTSLGVRMGIPYLAVPLAGLLMGLHVLAAGVAPQRPGAAPMGASEAGSDD
ncbi:MAG TPA: TRAP transporter small permease [Candidatus Sulfotelmatobacter sp.]|nr:TRAP transporter small permease [Candidatus Sulfotelmatobacter sp.]